MRFWITPTKNIFASKLLMNVKKKLKRRLTPKLAFYLQLGTEQ